MLNKEFSIAVMVSDAKKSAAWYKEKLGFESSVMDHWVTVGPKGTNWKIHLCEGELEPGNTGIAVYSDDVKGAVDDLKKKGVKFAQDYKKSSWGESAQFKDPDGNIIWIYPEGP